MWYLHLILIWFLWSISSVLGVIYILGLILYYVNKSIDNKHQQTKNKDITVNNSQSFRPQPQPTDSNSDVIEVGGNTSSYITNTNGYNNGQDFLYARDVVKRLKIIGDDKKAMLRLWDRKTNFLAIIQCENMTTRMYLNLLHDLKKYQLQPDCSNKTKLFLEKVFGENIPSIFDTDFYSSNTQHFVNNLYKLCEDTMRKHYHHNRKLNREAYLDGTLTYVDSETINFIEKSLQSYLPEKPTDLTKKQLSNLTPSAWKEELNEIRREINSNGYRDKTEKNILDLLDTNEYNQQFAELCLEACKVLAGHNKVEALICYMQYKAHTMAKGQTAEKLPDVIKKVVFRDQPERFNEFSSLPINVSLVELRTMIKSIFEVKRKKIIIDQKIVEQKREHDEQVVTEISKILSDDEQTLVTEKVSTLDDLFSNSISATEVVEYSELHKKFLKQFITSNYILPRDQIEDFSKKHNMFSSTLIDEINEVFYSTYEDNLILESENMYTISESYRSTIQIL
ncbi:MAG: tellurite resistance TerB C-terminal domain-containing protein [Candidatus Levyibacteriota bacterium]